MKPNAKGFLGSAENDPRRVPRPTPRINQVARLIIMGLTNQEIARCLGISHGSVRTHVWLCYKHYGVKNRVELAVALSKTPSVLAYTKPPSNILNLARRGIEKMALTEGHSKSIQNFTDAQTVAMEEDIRSFLDRLHATLLRNALRKIRCRTKTNKAKRLAIAKGETLCG
jgi:DNA-binding CsgD family transcriptional regulator